MSSIFLSISPSFSVFFGFCAMCTIYIHWFCSHAHRSTPPAVSRISNSLWDAQVGSVSRVTPYIFDGRTRANHVVDANTPFATSTLLPVRTHKSSWPTSRRVPVVRTYCRRRQTKARTTVRLPLSEVDHPEIRTVVLGGRGRKTPHANIIHVRVKKHPKLNRVKNCARSERSSRPVFQISVKKLITCFFIFFFCTRFFSFNLLNR